MLPWPAFGIDGFVIAVGEAASGEDDYRFAAGPVAEQKGLVVTHGGCGAVAGTCRLGDQLVDHVGETPATAQRPALPSRRRADGERLTAHLSHHVPITGLFQLRAERINQRANHLRRRAADRPRRVDQVTFQTRPSGPP